MHAQKLPEDVRELIIMDIYDNKLTLTEISVKYNVSLDAISRINVGRCWKSDKYTYPLRPVEP